jgi:hypothetical protein
MERTPQNGSRSGTPTNTDERTQNTMKTEATRRTRNTHGRRDSSDKSSGTLYKPFLFFFLLFVELKLISAGRLLICSYRSHSFAVI